jgi:2-polyprenyl-3-methyl-5-hydroxy-6-metoxy-1,4-benzoquinol methylase
MDNTAKSFKDKWEQNQGLLFEQTQDDGSDTNSWNLKRNGFADPAEFQNYLKGKKRILDAGCGNGRVTALLRKLSSPEDTEVVGIDLVSAKVARKNLKQFERVRIIEKDLLGDLHDLGCFDFIYCQEVLHHTDNPQAVFNNLISILEPDGEMAVYI